MHLTAGAMPTAAAVLFAAIQILTAQPPKSDIQTLKRRRRIFCRHVNIVQKQKRLATPVQAHPVASSRVALDPHVARHLVQRRVQPQIALRPEW